MTGSMPNYADVYITDFFVLADLVLSEEVVANLSLADSARLNGMTSTKRRRHFLMGRALLHLVLPNYGLRLDQLVVLKNDRPWLPGISFSLSHSDDRVALAVSRSAIGLGVDIEKLKPRNYLEIAKNCFSDFNYTQLKGFVDPSFAQDYFYQIWTLKEAEAKSLGRGFDRLLSKVGFHEENGVIPPACFWRTLDNFGVALVLQQPPPLTIRAFVLGNGFVVRPLEGFWQIFSLDIQCLAVKGS